MEAAPELKADEKLELQHATERQALLPPDAQEWAAAAIPRALAPMGALRAALLHPVERLEQLGELVSAKQRALPLRASRHVAPQREARQKSMAVPAQPERPLQGQQEAQALQRRESRRAAAQPQEPLLLEAPPQVAQQAQRLSVSSALP